MSAMTDQTPAPRKSTLPETAEFADYMASGWDEPSDEIPAAAEVAAFAVARREALSALFPGRRLIVPAGEEVVRSNDVEYAFRAHSAFVHLTGWGFGAVPGAVLELAPRDGGHVATLYLPSPAGPGSQEMFTDHGRGEFWIGPQPTIEELAAQFVIDTADLRDLPVGAGDELEVGRSDELDRAVAELRLVKDAFEIEQLHKAVDATSRGFDDMIRALPDAQKHPRGERIVEGAFDGRARVEGNGVGYGSIVASGGHACVLHWWRNDGPVQPGDLLLVDAGMEMDSCYTADITRTLPVSGVFSQLQRQIYQAVLDAADAALAIVRPGIAFHEIHDAAMAVIATRLDEWGLLPVPAAQALLPDQQQHRRYMVHGTSHHLGLDVHDCAQARHEHYADGIVLPGMVFTIEPGLYFREDDLTVPSRYRGIGVRIEDDILVTAEGSRNLSAGIPRTADDVEAWVGSLAELR
jgi:Xaa-Pro aminopeptidase